MSTLGRLLVSVGLLLSLIGLALWLPSSRLLDAGHVLRAGAELGARAFAGPVWRAVAYSALALVGLSLALGVGEIAWRWRGQAALPRFDELGQPTVRVAVDEVNRRLESCLQQAEPNVIAALDEIVRGGASVSASDIHISPAADSLRITYRVHGSLYELAPLPVALAPRLAMRVKVLARLDTYVRGVPQDGRLQLQVDSVRVEARVSTLPTEAGERIVLRLIGGSVSVPALQDLGLSGAVTVGLQELLAKSEGLLFVTGPVGSGKTTTLYSLLAHIAASRGRTTTLVTLEDPIELKLPFATQTQMQRRGGLTFPATLRSVLRQDPNVLMVGEIRDRETADIAMQAGLTGHLILTTVHGEGAAGPFARLVEMQIEPFILASATLGCLSQRLVRTLCTACRRQAEPEPVHLDRFARLGVEIPEGRYFEPVGCVHCEDLGFTGRMPIGELLVVTPDLRAAIHARSPTDQIYDLATREGMVPLLVDGLERAARGETSLTEVLRVAG